MISVNISDQSGCVLLPVAVAEQGLTMKRERFLLTIIVHWQKDIVIYIYIRYCSQFKIAACKDLARDGFHPLDIHRTHNNLVESVSPRIVAWRMPLKVGAPGQRVMRDQFHS